MGDGFENFSKMVWARINILEEAMEKMDEGSEKEALGYAVAHLQDVLYHLEKELQEERERLY